MKKEKASCTLPKACVVCVNAPSFIDSVVKYAGARSTNGSTMRIWL
jgi:hypothetical protein